MVSRRNILGAGGAILGLAAANLRGADRLRSAPDLEPVRRRMALVSLATGEHLDVEYRIGASLVPASMAAIAWLLRDPRSSAQHPIDATLIDVLHAAARSSGGVPVFGVLSGYRAESFAGGPRSLHGEGRAIDLRLAGVESWRLARRIRALSSGGVGYYRKADFVHLDSGGMRTWNG